MKNAVILVPSYEPDESFVTTINLLIENNYPVLVVNDGSLKEFDKAFNQVKDKVQYLEQYPNKGKGAALKFGFSKIKELFPNAKYVITADGDGQHSIQDINRVYDKLNETNELVFGTRHFDRKVPFRSRFGNDLSKATRSLLTKQFIDDDQCGLRGFPCRYLDELVKIHGDRYEYEMNEIVIFQLKQYKIVPIQIETIYLEKNSSSHFSPVLDTIKIQLRILSHSIAALFSIVTLILSLYFGIKNGMNSALVTTISYLGVATIYLGVISILYPTKVPFKRILNEYAFAIIKGILAWVILFAFVDNLKLPIEAFAPVAVIVPIFTNLLISYFFKK